MAAPQPVPPPPGTARDDADHEALRRLKTAYENAITSNQIDALAPSFHPDFHGVMVTGRPVNSFADVQQYWRDIRRLIGERGSYSTTLNPETSVILGDIALARGTTDDVVKTGDGHEYRFSTLWMATLERTEGSWKIRSVQGTMDPVGNPFVRDFARRAVIRFSTGAAAAGVVLGVLMGIVWQRRRATRLR